MKTHALGSMVLLVACGRESPPGNDELGGTSGGIDSLTTVSASDTEASATAPTHSGPDTLDETADDAADEGTVFDVGGDGFCKFKDPGIYCDDNFMTECGAGGAEIATENCTPATCLPDVGCVACLEGQYTCQGEKVMVCNTSVDPPVWEVSQVCNPENEEGCVVSAQSCQPLQQIGDVVPTGEYYQFADFTTGNSPFLGGYDVDSFEDRLYVLNYSNAIDVYEVELVDSDGDGKLEPNQHPDNPDAPGPIEQRVLTMLESIPSFGTPSLSSSELFALSDRLYIGGSAITENVLGVGTSVVTTPPGWAGWFAQIGYDDVNDVWYASNEGDRRVFQHCAATNTWGIAFYYPPLAGDHMDGLEVVTDPNTGTPYVYVSDMTSDFIGQYRLDSDEGWVQENLFEYAGTAGIVLEGMGFGALNHFWATGGSSVYEIGGGDLAQYTDPPG